MIEDSLLISSSLNMTDNSFTSESLIISYVLFNNIKRNTVKAFVNTKVTEYTFINKTTAYIICENLEISFISFSKLKLIKDFNKHLIK